MTPAVENLRLQKIVTVVAILLFLVKMVAWYITDSVSILTDALESTVNVVAGLIGVYSLRISAKPKDLDHPYGHGKIEFISAAIEGGMITTAGLLIIYKSIDNLLDPDSIEKLDYGIILIASTAVINYVLGSYCIKTGRKNSSLALIASGKHLKTDTWSTIGIIAGLTIIYFTNLIWLDSLVALGFSLFIIYTGYTIIRSSIAGIMDEADKKLLKDMVAMLNKERRINWIDLHNLRIIKYGATLHLDCHLTVPWYLNVNEAHDEIEALASLVRNQYGESVELFVHSDGCREFSCPLCNKFECPVRQHHFVTKLPWTVENILQDKKHSLDMPSE